MNNKPYRPMICVRRFAAPKWRVPIVPKSGAQPTSALGLDWSERLSADVRAGRDRSSGVQRTFWPQTEAAS